jgi:FAD/FMN-containing dehydrogenase
MAVMTVAQGKLGFPARRSSPSLTRTLPMKRTAQDDLADIVGANHVLSNPTDATAYTRDWRGRFEGLPAAIVKPGTTAEVSAVMAWASRHGVAIVPQGGNTGLVGGGIPDNSGTQVILSLGRLNRIRSLDRTNDSLVAEAGCILANVQHAAKEADRLFPLGLGSEGSCQIGGNIATNAGGLGVVRYGPMRDLVLGLEIVLPNGDVLGDISQLRKNNTGYDLKHLFIGSEGTLGIITAAALKLYPRARSIATAFCGLASPEDALETLVRVKERCGSRLSTFEIISGRQMEIVLHHTQATRPLGGQHPWYLLVELTDSNPDADLAELLLATLSTCMETNVLLDAVIAQSEAQRASFWAFRHAVSEANVKSGRVLSHDTSVPVSSGAAFIRQAEQALSDHSDLELTFVGHLGDGNIHAVALFDRDEVSAAEFETRAAEVSQIIYQISSSLGGSISAEHGIGVSLRDKLPSFKDPRELSLMRSIKRTIDPGGIMNPGKMFVD